MQKLFHKIIIIFLAPLVLFSTTSFTIEKHKCGEMICSVGLEGVDFIKKDNNINNAHADGTCGSDEAVSCCTGDVDCCIKDLVVVEGSKIKKERETQIPIEKVFSFNFLLVPFTKTTCNKRKLACQYANYSTPLITKDINIINEVFLI